MEEKTPKRSWNVDAFRALAERYHDDPAYRRRVQADPVAAFAEKGLDLPAGIEVRVVANTDDRVYVPIPPDPSLVLNDEMLNDAAGGGGTAGSAGSLTTVSTYLCACGPSTVSTVNSIGTFGSA